MKPAEQDAWFRDKPKLRVYTFMAGPRFTRSAMHTGFNCLRRCCSPVPRARQHLRAQFRDTVTGDFSYQPGAESI